MPVDDATLLRRWRDGSRTSGEALFERHYEGVRRFFANKVADNPGDLVQRTFMAALEKIDQLRDARSFRAFLFGVARYELLHYFRRKSRLEQPFDATEHSAFDLDPSPSGVLAEREEQRLLLEALRRIPLELQIVLELSYWEELTSAEIAQIAGLPVGTVKSRIRRAREQMEAALAELADSPAQLASTMANLSRWAEQIRAGISDRPEPGAGAGA